MRTRVMTSLGVRDEVWPDTFNEGVAQTVRAKLKYIPLLAKVHTIELLGMSDALSAELALRKPGVMARRFAPLTTKEK